MICKKLAVFTAFFIPSILTDVYCYVFYKEDFPALYDKQVDFD